MEPKDAQTRVSWTTSFIKNHGQLNWGFKLGFFIVINLIIENI